MSDLGDLELIVRSRVPLINVQTREDRTFSSFYDVELEARAEWLRSLAHGVPLPVGFGPLQPDPVLHP